MVMKNWLFICIIFAFSRSLFSQAPEYYDKSFHIKVEPLQLFQAFPAVGIGVEQKFSGHNVYASYHVGWDGLESNKLNTYFSDRYSFTGVHVGYKNIFPSGTWETYLGLEFRFDHVEVDVENGVLYDLEEDFAILFDEARYLRNRFGLFVTHGYELLFGKRLSFEFYGGIGAGYLTNNYDEIINPFFLEEVPPRTIRRKKHHQYVDSFWRMAFIGGVKFGYRI
jgi:hypothetical protein